MESIEESQEGYPEEAPPGADPTGGNPPSEETPQRRGGRPDQKDPPAESEAGDEGGTATGNPNAAG